MSSPTNTHARRTGLRAAAIGLALGVSALASCNLATPIAYAIYGPGKVEARFELDPEASTVVFVDDPNSQVGRRRDRDIVAQTATQTLLSKGLVIDMVDPQAATLAATKERHGAALSITEIGAAVDADVIVYALLTEFTLSADGNAYNPSAVLRVKVLDRRTGGRIWPDDPRGSTVRIRPEFRPGELPQDQADLAEANADLASRAGLAIAQLFYKHEITESVSR